LSKSRLACRCASEIWASCRVSSVRILLQPGSSATVKPTLIASILCTISTMAAPCTFSWAASPAAKISQLFCTAGDSDAAGLGKV